MLKMLLIGFTIVLVSILNFGCSHPQAPKPPPMPKCDLIATDTHGQYLRCKWNGQGEAWRIPIDTLYKRPERYTCTTDQAYAEAWKYGKELDRWISRNCK